MKEFWTWISQNWGEVAIAIVFVASIIVKFTPNDKDNKVINWIVKMLDHLSVAKTQQDKDLIKHAQENSEVKEDGRENI